MAAVVLVVVVMPLTRLTEMGLIQILLIISSRHSTNIEVQALCRALGTKLGTQRCSPCSHGAHVRETVNLRK